MKGLIFNFFEEYVFENHGETYFEEILKNSGFSPFESFVGFGTYPDQYFMAIISSASELLQISEGDLLRDLGKFVFPKFVYKFPQFITPYKHPKDFLKSIHGMVHVEVRKLYEGAQTPQFVYHEPSEKELVIEYHSPRKICQFFEGLIEGTGEYFHSPIAFQQKSCMHSGAQFCEYHLTFV